MLSLAFQHRRTEHRNASRAPTAAADNPMLCFSNPGGGGGIGGGGKKKHKNGGGGGEPSEEQARMMTRTLSAPPSLACSSPSPSVFKSRARDQQVLPPGSPGYHSLAGTAGLRREAVFRGEPLPLPTPESCGLAPESPSSSLTRPFSFPSPLHPQVPNMSSSPVHGSGGGGPSQQQAPNPLPRRPPPNSSPVACPPPTAHIRFSPDCIGEGGSGPAFKCSVLVDTNKHLETDAVLVRLLDPSMQDTDACMRELKVMAGLRHPHLSRILGFSFTADEKLVVYESQANGSLDRLLYGRTRRRPPLDWLTRTRIALDAAKGLAYLLEKSPNELVYKDFRTFNIHVDEDFRGKLVGYGFTRRDVDADSLMVAAYAAPELISGQEPVSDRSLVWSFGVVLLEILTGRQNRDEIFPKEQQDLVQWTGPYLADEKRLFLIVDPELKGIFSSKSVQGIATLAFECLRAEATSRPSMAQVVLRLQSLCHNLDASSSRKPLIEVLREGGSGPWSSPSMDVGLHSRTSLSVQSSMHKKKLASKLAKNLCTSAVAIE